MVDRFPSGALKKRCRCGHKKEVHVGGKDNYSGECCVIYHGKEGWLNKSCPCWKFEDASKNDNPNNLNKTGGKNGRPKI